MHLLKLFSNCITGPGRAPRYLSGIWWSRFRSIFSGGGGYILFARSAPNFFETWTTRTFRLPSTAPLVCVFFFKYIFITRSIYLVSFLRDIWPFLFAALESWREKERKPDLIMAQFRNVSLEMQQTFKSAIVVSTLSRGFRSSQCCRTPLSRTSRNNFPSWLNSFRVGLCPDLLVDAPPWFSLSRCQLDFLQFEAPQEALLGTMDRIYKNIPQFIWWLWFDKF
jgi:hypothetical protein